MIPRGAPDIRWSDLLAGVEYAVLPYTPTRAQARVEARWSEAHDTLVCLSVRSAFDLLLQVLSLPRGSEVLMSAVTIPDMVQIVTQHGLVPIPIDVDSETLAIDAAQVQQHVSPRTKALLVAHLFGSRMCLDPIIDAAHAHGLLVIEDGAQVYDASAYRGHAASDISMFSFGPIKRQTALGGALIRVRDPVLLAELRRRQALYPRQTRSRFLQRLGRFMLLKALARPWPFTLFMLVCRRRGLDYDAVLHHAVRGFAGTDLRRFRQQPSVPLLRLLDRRLRHADPQPIAQRAAVLSRLMGQHPALTRPGGSAKHHSHWMLPVQSSAPDTLVRLLRAHGFDATHKASSLVVVPSTLATLTTTTPNATQMLHHLVYLPVLPTLSERQIAYLHQIISEFEHQRSSR